MQGQLSQLDFLCMVKPVATVCEESIFSLQAPCVLLCFPQETAFNFIQCQFGYWIACQNTRRLPERRRDRGGEEEVLLPLLGTRQKC